VNKLSPTQERVLAQLADKRPAWVIRVGRITTLEALEKVGVIEIRLGHYGWEARLTQKGVDYLGKMSIGSANE